ncbi:MAG: aminoacetone oxidase family FAD-binding enzyme [Rikenellaceae bacterium]|nr:aminoacetone oxidase family FAD-binding enzyme [Rikenellaceae bacterium]
MKTRELIIVGAGAAGMMAAVAAAKNGVSVLLLEKMEKAGRKIRITGKGRCNITNTKDWNEFSSHIHPNANFFKHSFFAFSNKETISFFESIGLQCLVERGDRVYPESGVASDVVEKLISHLKLLGVEIRYNTIVREILHDGGYIKQVVYESGGKVYKEDAEAVIIATGGLSYPSTGSDGDGYKFAMNLGISLKECHPSLTALKPDFDYLPLKWLVLKNVELSLFVGKDLVQNEMGELEFTDNGLEGSIGYKVSRRAVKALINGEKVFVVIDLKPGVDKSTLSSRLFKDIEADKNIRRLLRHYMPEQLLDTFISYMPKRFSSLNVADVKIADEIAAFMKEWKMVVKGYTSYERAVITAGGVSLDEIVAKKMVSRKFPNLFFAGEVIDLDGDTGGYNLQIAFSTGYTAGREAAYLIRKLKDNDSE